MNDLSSLRTSYISKLILEYGELSAREHLSEDEENRMAEILILATNDPILDFWLSEIDYCVAYSLGMLEDNYRNYYRNQQALLSEYAEITLPSDSLTEVANRSNIRNETLKSVNERLAPNCLNTKSGKA